MKDKKKLKVLIKIIKIIYDKNTGMQEMIDLLMMEVCAEEGVISRTGIFLQLSLS